MADTFARMRQIAGSTAEWAANDIVLGDGEVGVERIGFGDIRIKIGNGTAKWSQLPYVANTIAAVDAQVAAASVHALTAKTEADRAGTIVATIEDDVPNINLVAANMASVNTVASDLNEPVSEINTVASSIANVNAVGTSITNVNTTAANIGNVNTVGNNIGNVNLNASNMAAIQGASANAVSAASSATAAANSATAAASSATNASSSATTAVAAAQSSGNIVFYDTKALANAGLAGLPADQVIEVFNDESRSGQRTRYRKEGSVYVFKMYLPKSRDVYVDSVTGNDSNDGLLPGTPKQSLAAAFAVAQPGSTLWLARGSQWFGGNNFFPQQHMNVRPYGQGNKPIIDGAFAVTGTWTQDATYTNLWYIDVTLPAATTGVVSNLSSAWHPMLWDEASSSRTTESGMLRALNGDTVNGSVVSLSGISSFLALINDIPGAFYVHRTGSTNHEPRGDNGTTFRFYARLSDSSNPNTNGRTIYTVGQYSVANFVAGISVRDVVFQRTGGKDMVGVQGGATKVQEFVDCDFLEAAVHATVVGGAEFRRCVARAARHGDAVKHIGAAFHNFRDVSSAGMSRGFKLYDCEAYSFGVAVYSHGDAGGFEHNTFDVDGLLSYDCGTVIGSGAVRKSCRLRRITAVNCQTLGPCGRSVFEDCIFINVKGSLGTAYIAKDSLTLRNCFVYKVGSLGLIDPYALGTIAAADYPTLVLENSTIIATVVYPGTPERRQQHWVLINSILHTYQDSSFFTDGDWLLGTITATNSYIGLNASDIQTLRAARPGIASNCVSNRYRNKFQKTVVLSDLSFQNTNRIASYSGTPNPDGSADLTLNFNNQTYGRYIRVVDAYGAGLHYEGRVTSLGATNASPIQVTPAPTAAFANKALHFAYWNRKIWDNAYSETAPVSFDGLKIRVADASLFTIGMLIWVGRIGGRGSEYGPRIVNAITGNVITLNAACSWAMPGDVEGIFNNIENTVANRKPLPTTTIGFGFPVIGTTQVYPYPRMSLAAVEGTSGIAKLRTDTHAFADPSGGIAGVNYLFTARRTNGVAFDYGAVLTREGYVDVGWQLAVGDTLTVEAVAQVDAWEPKLATNPLLSLDGSLEWNSYLANLGIGYAKRTLREA